MKIKDIGDFRYGYHTTKQSVGEIQYITAKHFDNDHQFLKEIDDSFINTPDKKVIKKFLLKTNDVIITGKGYRIFAWSYDKSAGDCIPSTLFFKMSLDPKIIYSKFFEIQFNTFIIDEYLSHNIEGSTIPTIKSKDLLDTPIIIPSLMKQKEIIRIWEMMSEQLEINKSLTRKLRIRNELQIKEILKGL